MSIELLFRIDLPIAVLSLFVFATAFAASPFGQPQIGAVAGLVPTFTASVVNFGTVIYTGAIDLNPTLDRIRQGTKLNERNDGSIFTNSEGLIPVLSDSQYYREFVHAPAGFPFPGPQRVLIGKGGEVYYTGDHYVTAKRVN